ncbi:hypothetical protein Pmani_008488 [Petrolisthes manimaculis]|uniref:Nuclease HARBI1 n=1 Tax=Petrolisthes manimaculis TaxID=1843537 RepID=A0AAE1Q5H8_9EUCA|nr:hypothetical protein Pmani_009950 [Petrolisthes manimaculis]KAK4319124.1 hypothetical protein Pmani_009954 [Petrolisthes manimaculis]KAK4320655.1 hypothetical protein Pmani_008488 [Petrolisthes manimaculis]
MDVLHEIYAGILDELDEEELQPRRLHRIVPRDRSDPMAYLADHEFIQRFRLSKDAVRDLLEEIRPRLPRVGNGRGCSVPQYLQLLAALRYMATGNFKISMGDCLEMSTTSVCRSVKRIATGLQGISNFLDRMKLR